MNYNYPNTVQKINEWLKRAGATNLKVRKTKSYTGIADVYELLYKSPNASEYEIIFVGMKPVNCAQYLNHYMGIPLC